MSKNTSNIHPLLHIPVPWVFVIAYLIGVGIQLLIPVTISSVVLLQITQTLSILLLTVGAVFAAWAQWIFRKEHTTTDPNQTSSRLVTWGPYRFSRNPMYIGLLLIFIGISGIFTLVWSILLQIFVVYYVNWVVIPVEEKQLRGTFGEVYEHYCVKVRRWI
jgi:protein-S-isoprenylcysteine O-methyltransferase Ste14